MNRRNVPISITIVTLSLLIAACNAQSTSEPHVIPTKTLTPLLPTETPTLAPTLTPVPLPISDEELASLRSNYTVEGNRLMYKSIGVLEVANDGQLKIKTQEGGEMLFAPEDLSVKAVSGMTFDGMPIDGILVMDAPGWGTENTFIHVPTWGEQWVTPIDVDGSLAAETIEQFTEIAYDDITSGRLLYSELLVLPPMPANVAQVPLRYIPAATDLYANQTGDARLAVRNWVLSPYPDANHDESYFMGKPQGSPDPLPFQFENSPVRPMVGKYRAVSPLNGNPIAIGAQPYYYKGRAVILHIGRGDASLSDNGEFLYLNEAFSNEPWSFGRLPRPILEPVIAWASDVNDPGCALDTVPQPTMCALVGHGVPAPMDMLPSNARAYIERESVEPQPKGVFPSYAVGDEILPMQGVLFVGNMIDKHRPEFFGL